jgi:hypothetical protein
MMGLALGLIFMAAPVRADDGVKCLEATTMVEFLHAAKQGEHAFADMDLPALSAAQLHALSLIPCLGDPVGSTDAAAFHRMMALAAFTSGDSAAVMREFHAARRLEPGYVIPTDVAPPGHPLMKLYDSSTQAEEGELQAAIPPLGGWVGVDGVRGAPRPSGISTLIQVFDAGDQLEQTLYLLPDETMPSWGPLPMDQLRRKRRRVTLLGATGGAAVVSGALYGLALRSKAQFWEPNDTLDEADLEVMKMRTNALAWTSLGSLGLATGLGITTAVVW